MGGPLGGIENVGVESQGVDIHVIGALEASSCKGRGARVWDRMALLRGVCQERDLVITIRCACCSSETSRDSDVVSFGQRC